MQESRLEDIARGNVERHLDNVSSHLDDVISPDEIYDEAYTLGHDALIKVGCDTDTACRIAEHVARCYAQP